MNVNGPYVRLTDRGVAVYDPPPPSPPRRPPVTRVGVRRAHPLAWRKALELADGDARRLDVQEDGSVIVWNHRVR